MANTRERVKDFPSIVGTIQSDDYFPVDGATQGVRKAQVKDIMDAPITGLDTIANTTKGAINELATTAGKVWVGTQDEYDALPDTKLTDKVLHCITDGEPSAYDSIWDKVGTDPLATTASDCSGAINELKQSLSLKLIAQEIPYSNFTFDSTNNCFVWSNPTFTGITPLFFVAYATNGGAMLSVTDRRTSSPSRITIEGYVPNSGSKLTSAYQFKFYAVGVST